MSAVATTFVSLLPLFRKLLGVFGLILRIFHLRELFICETFFFFILINTRSRILHAPPVGAVVWIALNVDDLQRIGETSENKVFQVQF